MLLEYLQFVLSIALLFLDEASGYNLTVKTDAGYVRGYQHVSDYEGITFYSFKGIPYGEPPVGSLRFQDPQPVSSWEDVRDAFKHGSDCPHFLSGLNIVYGNEDCLYLNVYVPQTDEKNEELSLPVMVWIHGGGFVNGSSAFGEGYDTYYDPSYLMTKPIIIVSMNYRLGVLGFLSTEDENAWGNSGLKDQVLALKWVQNNIANFGGNPKRVTIFGESAGSVSVGYHLLSPMSRGLFKQTISESGCTLNDPALGKNAKGNALALAQQMGLNSIDTKEVVKTLQAMDYKTLITASFKYNRWFSPCIEGQHENAFIPKNTYDLWGTGNFAQVPMIFGYNSEEGLLGYASYVASLEANEDIEKRYIPAGLNINSDSSEAEEVAKLIRNEYFPDGNYHNLTNAFRLLTQATMIRGVRKNIADIVQTSSVPLYFYKFDYVGTHSMGINGGAVHAEEMQYIWHSSNLTTAADLRMKDRMVTMWTNFAVYGDPTPEEDEVLSDVLWLDARKGVSGEDVNVLMIKNDLVVGLDPDQEDYLFWKGIYDKYANGTTYTY